MRLLFGTPDASGIEHQRFNEDQSARLRLRKVRLLSPTYVGFEALVHPPIVVQLNLVPGFQQVDPDMLHE